MAESRVVTQEFAKLLTFHGANLFHVVDYMFMKKWKSHIIYGRTRAKAQTAFCKSKQNILELHKTIHLNVMAKLLNLQQLKSTKKAEIKLIIIIIIIIGVQIQQGYKTHKLTHNNTRSRWGRGVPTVRAWFLRSVSRSRRPAANYWRDRGKGTLAQGRLAKKNGVNCPRG